MIYKIKETLSNISKNLNLFTQKQMVSVNSIYKNILNRFSVILEDEKRFYSYYKKRFPKSFKYLPIVKFVTFLSMLFTLEMDYQTYSSILSSTISEEKSLISTPTKFYSKYSFCFYGVVIVYEYLLSIFVTLKANSPIRDFTFQLVKHTAKATVAISTGAVGYSYAPVEPNEVSNFVHTKTWFGRGWDYEIGSVSVKTKGDLISGALGHENMLNAAQKHVSDNGILGIDRLNSIINDDEFKSKIRTNTTKPEKFILGIPLLDISFNSSNVMDSDVPNTNNSDNYFPESEDNNNEDEEAPITAVITLFKSKAAVSTCPTPTAFYPDINFWNYIGSVIKGTITDLTAPLLWKLIFGACCIFLIGYGTVSIYNHAVEIYQIVHFYKQIVGSPELVEMLNNKFEFLNHFNREAASQISKLTFNLLNSDDCQIIVKFCLYNKEYSFHGILMDISNSNMI